MFVISRGRSATIECSLHTCDLWMMRWYEMHWVLSSCVGLCHPLPQWQRPSTPLVAMSVMSSNCFNCGPLSQGVQVFACKINCPLYKEIRMVHFSIIIGMFAFSEYGEITQKNENGCVCVWVCVCVRGWDEYSPHLLTRRLRMPLGCNIFGSSMAAIGMLRYYTVGC